MADKPKRRGKPRRVRPIGEAQAIAVRRLEVFKRLRGGQRQVDIARDLQVSTATVSLDVKKGMAELNAETLTEAGQYRALARAKLDALYAAYEDAALEGDEKAAAVCLAAYDRWQRLLGLEAPQKHEITGTGVAVQVIQQLVETREHGDES